MVLFRQSSPYLQSFRIKFIKCIDLKVIIPSTSILLEGFPQQM